MLPDDAVLEPHDPPAAPTRRRVFVALPEAVNHRTEPHVVRHRDELLERVAAVEVPALAVATDRAGHHAEALARLEVERAHSLGRWPGCLELTPGQNVGPLTAIGPNWKQAQSGPNPRGAGLRCRATRHRFDESLVVAGSWARS